MFKRVANRLPDVLAYSHDILVTSSSLVDHFNALAELVNRLGMFDLRINVKEYQLKQHETDFLGYTISS